MSNESNIAALQTLARQDVMGLRLSGLILGALVHRGVMTNQEVRALIQDVVMHLTPDMDAYREALTELHEEFQ